MLYSSFSEKYIEAGCDEVGRGCLAGPVVAAAVILPQDYEHAYLNDSKMFAHKKRLLLAEDIKHEALAWAIAEVDNHEIDNINILRASFLAMHRAIDQLLMVPELLLIDGNRFDPYQAIPHECIVKGDSKYLSIAAASILAKTYRDEKMSAYAKTYNVYGWDKNFGYPTKQHKSAILDHGITPLHRRSYRLENKQLGLFE